MTVRIPKVRSKSGDAVTFRSALVPPYVRKIASLEAALPWLYLKGISTGEMSEALKVLLGPQASGSSPATVSRLKQVWAQDYRDWSEQRLDQDRWVYVWADGVYSGLRAEQIKLCALVVIGVNERGEKRFLAIEDLRAGNDTELARSAAETQVTRREYPCIAPSAMCAMGFWGGAGGSLSGVSAAIAAGCTRP